MYYSYKKIFAWQKAMDLTDEIYSLTNTFPRDEKYNLIDQMRRAVVSIPSNIAEGRARGSDKDFLRFLAIARGSCAELETQLLISENQGYITSKQAEAILPKCDEVSRLITKLISTIKEQENSWN